MSQEHSRHRENLRRRYEQRLRVLEEKAAIFGINTPPEVTIEIEDIHIKLAQIGAMQSTSIRSNDFKKDRLLWVGLIVASLAILIFIFWWRSLFSPTNISQQEIIQSTIVAIVQQQNEISRGLATAQANNDTPKATATALAEQTVKLISTQQALEVAQKQVQATQTVLASAAPQSAASLKNPRGLISLEGVAIHDSPSGTNIILVASKGAMFNICSIDNGRYLISSNDCKDTLGWVSAVFVDLIPN